MGKKHKGGAKLNRQEATNLIAPDLKKLQAVLEQAIEKSDVALDELRSSLAEEIEARLRCEYFRKTNGKR